MNLQLIQQTQYRPDLGLLPQALQSLSVLAMPIDELEQWIQEQTEQNPLLEVQEEGIAPPISSKEQTWENGAFHREYDEKKFTEDLIPAQKTRFEYILEQVHCYLDSLCHIQFAEWVLGSLDSRGFLNISLEEYPESLPYREKLLILRTIQRLDPPGIAAKDAREALLIQLELQHKSDTPAYAILSHYYLLFLQQKHALIAHQLHIKEEDVQKIIQKDILPLNPHPGQGFQNLPNGPLRPDIILASEENDWKLDIHTMELLIHNGNPCDLSSPSERAWYLQQASKAKYVVRSVLERKKTLTLIGEMLLRTQHSFLSGESSAPRILSVEQSAEELGFHRSTLSRAIKDKMVSCPQGILPLKFFFQAAAPTPHAILRDIIQSECKRSPLSDAALAQRLRQRGIPCARRTVAKYRRGLNIDSHFKRRKQD